MGTCGRAREIQRIRGILYLKCTLSKFMLCSPNYIIRVVANPTTVKGKLMFCSVWWSRAAGQACSLGRQATSS